MTRASGQEALCVGSWSHRRTLPTVGHDPIVEGSPTSGAWPKWRYSFARALSPSRRWPSQEGKWSGLCMAGSRLAGRSRNNP
eukprot:7386742-Pyramimonas_sp.AAC.1